MVVDSRKVHKRTKIPEYIIDTVAGYRKISLFALHFLLKTLFLKIWQLKKKAESQGGEANFFDWIEEIDAKSWMRHQT